MWTSDFKDYISKCLKMEAGDRWGADQLLGHAFITSACTPQDFEVARSATGLGLRVEGLEFEVARSATGLGFRVEGLGLRVEG
jgi:hypothetical protein